MGKERGADNCGSRKSENFFRTVMLTNKFFMFQNKMKKCVVALIILSIPIIFAAVIFASYWFSNGYYELSDNDDWIPN